MKRELAALLCILIIFIFSSCAFGAENSLQNTESDSIGFDKAVPIETTVSSDQSEPVSKDEYTESASSFSSSEEVKEDPIESREQKAESEHIAAAYEPASSSPEEEKKPAIIIVKGDKIERDTGEPQPVKTRRNSYLIENISTPSSVSTSTDLASGTDDQISVKAGELNGSPETKAAATNLFNEINAFRAARGYKAYNWSNGLENAAEVRAVEASQRWSHTRPDNNEYWSVNEAIVYGESLLKGFYNASSAFEAMENDPLILADVLDAYFRTIGICIHMVGDQWFWAVEYGY